MERITKNQQAMIDIIDKFSKKNGRLPTIQEIRQAGKTKSKASVYYHINNLINKGYYTKIHKGKYMEIFLGAVPIDGKLPHQTNKFFGKIKKIAQKIIRLAHKEEKCLT